MKANNHSRRVISNAWTYAITQWQLLSILYLANLLLAYLLLSPLRYALSRVLANRLQPDTISFTFFSDLYSNQLYLFHGQSALIIVGLVVYLLWLIFSSAGISNTIIQSSTTLRDFWIGGCTYFFCYLRLTFYMLLILGCILFLAALGYNFGETNVFMIESEQIFIHRAIWISTAVALAFTFVKLWNDTLKLIIARSTSTWFFRDALSTWRFIVQKRLISTFIINVIIAILIILALLYLKKIVNSSALLIFIISQVIMIVRLTYKVANLKSINDRLYPS